ncbi:hypothetical protein AXX17_AT1G40650 [Arabidopsis thaliana]|uniref:SNARE associated Golgi protein family n=1 Tax=Arabidopsis thaliana TaxID=3702 RepID=A0A178WK58_ARATH|nr:hypothetical protein AXX17_AT1G40650 [Arabidopsis thaliana]
MVYFQNIAVLRIQLAIYPFQKSLSTITKNQFPHFISRFLLFSSQSSVMKKWLAIAATVAIIAIIVRQGTTQYGWNKEAALEKLKEWSDRLGIWAIPTYVAVHTITLALCLPHAVFFEAGASMLFGFLPALLCVFSAKVLAASFSFWIGRSVSEFGNPFLCYVIQIDHFGSFVCV